MSVPIQRKEVYSGAMQPGRMVDLCLKDHIPFLLKPAFLIGIGGRRVVFYPIILLAFGMMGSCLFIFLVFGALSGGTSPSMSSWPNRETSQCSLSVHSNQTANK